MTPPASTEPVFGIPLSELNEWEQENLCWSEVQDLQRRIRARGPVQQAQARQNICQICASGQQEPFCIGCYHLKEHDAAIAAQALEDVLARLDKEIATRENEMNRKCNLEDNITTASGYAAAAGALNWVRVVLIDGLLNPMKMQEREPE